MVKRDVIRLVTAGTLTEENLLDSRRNNFLLSLAKTGDMLGVSWLDLSTGDFFLEEIGLKNKPEAVVVSSLLSRLSPVEILVSDRYLQSPKLFEVFNEYRKKLSVLPEARFNFENARRNLLNLFKVETLDAYGNFSRAEITAAGVLMDYVETTQKGQMPRVEKPVKIYERQVMEIDGATRRSLELLESSSGDRGNSLLSVLDRTVTGAGARMLAGRIASPLVDTKEIGERLNVVEFFLNEEFIRDDVRALLKACPDIERAVSRLSLERGGPRDLAAIKTTLAAVPRLKNILSGASSQNMVSNCRKPLPALPAGWDITKIWWTSWSARWPTNCRCWPETAVSSAKATTRRLTKSAGLRTIASRLFCSCRKSMRRRPIFPT